MGNIASLSDIGNLASSLIGPQIGYIANPEKKMEELDNNARYLFARRDDVEEIIRESPNVATREIKLWLEDVKKAELLVESTRAEHAQRSYVFSRLTFGKRVERVIDEIADLKNKQPELKGKEFSNAPLERAEPQIVEINSSTDCELRLQEILGLIEDVNIRKIGIWGMGGVGKTRTLKLLNNHPDVSKTFEIVIWVTVSKDRNRRKMQNEIAHRLNLRVPDVTDDDQLQATICKTLWGKKFLLLLDDLWEKIDLPDVGIPSLDQDNGGKVVFTTRSLGICRWMETDEDVRVETLPKDEAWCLFSRKAGEVAMSPDINPIARLIVEECAGLPLAIIVVGSSLRKINDIVVWKNTLRELQKSQCEAIDEPVFRSLRFSYDRLQNEWKKKLFLFCSLYPEDFEISIAELAEYCWVEGYIHGVGSIEEARDKGHCMAIDLVDASLLERCDKQRCVKMHDVVRDFALTEGRGFLVKAGMKIMHPPGEDEWLQSQKISLMRSTSYSLLKRPNCRILTTLLLQYSHQRRMIPKSFFELMVSLTTLDLSGTNLQMLPRSVGKLVNLRGLYLRDCTSLRYLPSQVRLLIRLEVLDLGGTTAIKYLPREIGELIGLKRLIVGFEHCRLDNWYINHVTLFRALDEDEKWDMNLRVPIGIIPNLPLLEELAICTYLCAEKDQWDDKSMKVVVDELCSLDRLTYLDFYFPNENCLAHFLHESKSWKGKRLGRFRFRVGTERPCRLARHDRKHEAWERCLVYNSGHEISDAAAIKETLARCSFFHLRHHPATQKLSDFGMANMNELKICRIEGCEKMEFLFGGGEEQETREIFPNLEKLEIFWPNNLRRLWVGQLLPGSLSKLTHLELHYCHSHHLKKVFQLGMIQQLPSLESLNISYSSVEEIIGIEDETAVPYHTHISNDDTVILPNIKRIVLRHLPRLVTFSRGVSLEWPSLEYISIFGCGKLKSLSFLAHGTNNVAPALKKIHARRSWWKALEWEDNGIKQRLQPLFQNKTDPYELSR